ncbi:hypothetical protein SSUST3_2019 [Streptococcus suis ST3]|nr:hypothetical protein SSUST3_2019 [Streptococcus suis ST3]AGW88373.1 hypothetical protein YB51_10005 [Streptococcus suis YB51]
MDLTNSRKQDPLDRVFQIEEKVHFGQFSSIFFLYVENKKLSETPKYQCF